MSAPSPIVVFDVGNVLLRWDPHLLYAKLIPDAAKRDWFVRNVCTAAWNIEQDRGRSWEDAVATLVAQHPEWTDEIRASDARWHETIPGTVEDKCRDPGGADRSGRSGLCDHQLFARKMGGVPDPFSVPAALHRRGRLGA